MASDDKFLSVEAEQMAQALASAGLLPQEEEAISEAAAVIDGLLPAPIRTRPAALGLGVGEFLDTAVFVKDGRVVRLALMNGNDDSWLKALQQEGWAPDSEIDQYVFDTKELFRGAPEDVVTGYRVMAAYPDRFPDGSGGIVQNSLLTYDAAWIALNGARVPTDWYDWRNVVLRGWPGSSALMSMIQVNWSAMLVYYRHYFDVVCAVCLDGGGRSALQRLGVNGISLNDPRWMTDAGCLDYMKRALELLMAPRADDANMMWEIFNEPDVWKWFFEWKMEPGRKVSATLNHAIYEDWAGKIFEFIRSSLGVKGLVSMGLPGYDVCGLHATPWGNIQGPSLSAASVGSFAGGHFYEQAEGPGGIIEGISWQMERDAAGKVVRWPEGVARFDGEMALDRTPEAKLSQDWSAIARAFPKLNVGLWGIQTPGQKAGLCLNPRDERPSVRAAVEAVKLWIRG